MKIGTIIVFIFSLSIQINGQTFDELIGKGDEQYAAKNYAEAIKLLTYMLRISTNRLANTPII